MHLDKTGLVLGKFLPLHKGHELLLRFASHYVNTLYIVVDNIPDATISGALRCQWLKELIPNATVCYVPTPNPQHPDEHPDFWTIWKNSLINLMPQKPDYVFASEDYGCKLAEVLDAQFIPLDIQRQLVPISGTQIRNAPLAHWDYLSAGAQCFYLKRVCLFGPESTGKTTLASMLARHYRTQWVPEYARLYLESHPKIKLEDMVSIAEGQIALEKTLAPMANKILFCDTDPLLTTLWSQWLFEDCLPELMNLASHQTYDLYLVMSPDIEWKADSARYFPGRSVEFFNQCIDLLTSHHCKFAIVNGKGQDRLASAVQHIEEKVLCLE